VSRVGTMVRGTIAFIFGAGVVDCCCMKTLDTELVGIPAALPDDEGGAVSGGGTSFWFEEVFLPAIIFEGSGVGG